MTDPVKKLLAALRDGPCSPELRVAVGIKHRQTFRANYLNPAIRVGLICAKDGLSPHDPNMCYSLTDLGLRVLDETVNETVNEAKRSNAGPLNDRINEAAKRPDVVINVGIKFTQSEESVIKAILKNPKITAPQLGDGLGMTSRQMQRIIASLKQKAGLFHEGSRKSGIWRLPAK